MVLFVFKREGGGRTEEQRINVREVTRKRQKSPLDTEKWNATG